MNIAEKLTVIAENAPRIFENGYTTGQAEGYANGKAEGIEEGKNKFLISTITIASAITNCSAVDGLLSGYQDENKFIYCMKQNPKLNGTINNEFIDYGYAYNRIYARRYRSGSVNNIIDPTSSGYDCILKVGDIVEIYEVELCDSLRL